MSKRIKSKTRESALPRRRSAAALSLQSPRHRQRVIPDKRRAANKRTGKFYMEVTCDEDGHPPRRFPFAGAEPRDATGRWTALGDVLSFSYTREECEKFLRHDIEAIRK